MNTNSTNLPELKPRLAELLLFAVPCLSLVTGWGVGLSSILFFLVALFYSRLAREALAQHWLQVRWVLLAFALPAAAALLFLALRPDVRGASVEKPLRMLLAASAMLVVLVCKPDRRALWGGVIGGAVAGLVLLGVQRYMFDIARPGGQINPITAGDIMACLALLALASSADLRGRAAVLPWLGLLAGSAGLIITGTRGGIIALALGALIYTWHMRAAWWSRLVPLACLALALAAWLVPATGVRSRVMEGVQDLQRYTREDMAFSSLGLRLELWQAGGRLIAERPLLGAGPATVSAQMRAFASDGSLEPEALAMPHFHNDAIQALVSGGVVGLVAWLGTMLAPLAFFWRRLDAGAARAPALAGVMLTTSYLAFGLTEVIFWSTRASLLYAMLVFILMGLCLNAKEQDGK